ncbi:potassium channel family protein [Pontibacter oryzae]|nr:potassium channel family protein [Pontibacter oryzae]
MNDVIYLIIGILILGTVSYDLIYTTFSPRGAGFVSRSVSTVIWRSLFWLSRLFKYSKMLNGAGIIIVVSILLSWVMMLWIGNAFIFLSDTDAVVNSTTKVPAGLVERIYFTGYNLSTMGNGDYMAGTDGWRIYTAFISFSGLIMITIGVTYMVPVLSAITSRRALSIRITSIGQSPQLMLLNNWNGSDFKQLESHFENLAQPVAEQGQSHLAYPVLHFFHHTDKEAALLPNLAALDEAITILLLFVPEDKRPANNVIIPLRQAITTFLGSLTVLYLDPSSVQEPSLNIKKLQESDIPLEKPDTYKIEKLNKRRRILKAMLDYDGWEWDEVSAPAFDPKMDLPEMV